MADYNYSSEDIKRILEEKKAQFKGTVKEMTEEECRQRDIECFDYDPDLSQVEDKWWLKEEI